MSSATAVTNEFCCSEMQFHLLAGELGLVYSRQFRQFGILYRDGGSSIQLIYYCPWCGSQLPISLGEKRIAATYLQPAHAHVAVVSNAQKISELPPELGLEKKVI